MQSTGTPSSSLVTARLTRLVTVNNLSYVSSAVTSPRKTPAESVAAVAAPAVVRGKEKRKGKNKKLTAHETNGKIPRRRQTCADLGDGEMVIAITHALPVNAGSFHYL